MPDLSLFGGNSFFYPTKNNTFICYKILEKGDRQRLIDGFNKLSNASIYHRFFGKMKELSERQLDDFLNTDDKDHIAWVAFDIIEEEVYGVGVGRFRRSKTISTEAELALTVIDEYQNLGVGTTLLGILYFLAAKLDIEVFTGTIMSDNVKLIRRFKELGAVMTRIGSEYEMRLPVKKAFDDMPKTSYAEILKPTLNFLKDNNFCA
jgi:GNAT superfamily N-acetyltransferase